MLPLLPDNVCCNAASGGLPFAYKSHRRRGVYSNYRQILLFLPAKKVLFHHPPREHWFFTLRLQGEMDRSRTPEPMSIKSYIVTQTQLKGSNYEDSR